ncbi:class I SAM-dependent methyltransferase [Cryptosporangium aurantiacum]|uniref:Methyltransferase domain-containing protein n=1 Tax=Cryptosporangium aurantiacum TaxID=134849 RepID=A0A1M7QVV0_9ACTN|nr:class I SAM-dependent methyltransferase [Cryptosporangium aurantiacum]SHN35945.1 Methyltransferase domain-containing protein [Cryptosporangium aurantiacum]
MEVSDIEALRSAAGEAALSAASAEGDPLALATRLRAAGHDPHLVSLALTQQRLRRSAAIKLGSDASAMLFTIDAVEQATRNTVATRRASHLAASGATRVIDLGCGAGSDLLAMARAGLDVTGVERDPVTAAVAAANVEALGLTDHARVICADATEIDLNGYDAAFCDPARRSGGRRVFDPDAYSPPWSFVLALAERIPRTVVKIAPGIDHDRIPAGTEAQWVSERGEVVEAALWFGPLADVPRRATLLPGATARDLTTARGAELTGTGDREAPVGAIGAYLYDPDGAVVRAHLVAELADQLGGRLLDPAIAYLTTDELRVTPFARAYRIDTVLPFGVKRLRAELARRGVGRLEIKKRGTAVTPEQLRPQLKLSGPNAATLILTRVAGKPLALLCEPSAD